MCKAIDDMMQDSMNEGRIEGKIEGKILAYYDVGLSIEEISIKMNLSADEIESILHSSEN